MVKFNLILDLCGTDVGDLKLIKEFSFPFLPRQGETIIVGQFLLRVESIKHFLEEGETDVFCDYASSSAVLMVVNSPGGWSFDGSDSDTSETLLSEMKSLGVVPLPEWCN